MVYKTFQAVETSEIKQELRKTRDDKTIWIRTNKYHATLPPQMLF